jgi:hypothetical protein
LGEVLEDRLETELGVPASVAASIAERAAEPRGAVVFRGEDNVASVVADRLRGVGLDVECVDSGIVEDRPELPDIVMPRRRGRD